MNKKLLLIVFGVLALAASFFITLNIDPATAKYKSSLVNFHQNSTAVYVDGYFKDEFLPQVTNEDYKTQIQPKINEMTEIINKEVDPNLIFTEVSAKSEDELKEKTTKAIAGIEKLLAISREIEKNMPEDVKGVYKPKAVDNLEALYNSVPSAGIAVKKTLRFLFLVILIVASGVSFIFVERKARKTGEIKHSEVA